MIKELSVFLGNNIYRKYITLFFCAAFLFIPHFVSAVDYIKYTEELKQNFVLLDMELAKHDRYFKRDNKNGGLTWQDSKILLAYVKLYEKTGEPWLLEKAVKLSNDLLSFRDDETGIENFAGKITPTWSSERYTDGNRYSHIVHSGMILYPIIRLAYILKADGVHDFESQQENFISRAEETVLYHEFQWNNETGCYEFREDAAFLSYPGEALPFNQQTAFGRVLLFLYLLTENELYKKRAIKLVDFIKENFNLKEEAYSWQYRNAPFSRVDDIGHAGLVIDFLALCYKYNIAVTDVDIQRLIYTYKKNVFRFNSKPARYINGTGEGHELSLPGWLVLSFWDRTVYDETLQYFVENKLYENMKCSGRYFQAISNFIYYAPFDITGIRK